jgi:subtilisin
MIMGKRLLAMLAIVLGTLCLLPLRTSAQAPDAGANQPDVLQLAEVAQANGSVPLIVGLALPGYDESIAGADVQAAQAQQAAIAAAQAGLLNRLAGYAVGDVKTFDYIPYLALRADAATLAALRADPAVTSIVEDIALPPALERSVPLVRADGAQTLNYRGSGTAVAILDTGVDRNHPDLAGRVVYEACYSTTDPAIAYFSACPNGQSSQLGTGAAAPPSRLVAGFDHGTHVAAVAARMAPSTGIVAIQVFSRVYENAARQCTSQDRRSPCTLTRQSDFIKGLERVLAVRATYNIVAVNMSLGGGAYVSACDALPQFTSVKLIIDILRSAGVATVIAAGNDSMRFNIGAPACISSAISVGATATFPDGQVDDVADFSNMAPFMTLLAPGTPINAAVPGTTTDCGNGNTPVSGRCFKGGTSMAAPHVAGAIAVLRSAKPAATVNEIVNALTTSGLQITDQRSGGFVTKRRLDVYGALCRLVACDPDEFRTLTLGISQQGTISAGDPGDTYYFNGTAGQRIIVAMTNATASLDPFLSVWDPDGNLVAFNDNGGGGKAARINLLILPRTGRYRINAGVAQSGSTGGYSIGVAQGTFTQNPAPFVRGLQPGSATVGSGGFWARIDGANFLNSSVARLNGTNYPTFFSSSERIWIWLYPSDLSSTGARTVDVVNPTPGGGTSLPLSFSVTPAFNGESRLLAPPTPATTVGISTTFAISWTHPTDSWRNMQNLHFRLMDEALGGPLWLRLTEENPISTLALLNSSGTAVYSGTLASGQFGIGEDWVISDTVTLHFGQTSFFGSGQSIVITPVVTFGPAAIGAYDLRFAVDDDLEASEVQNGDVFGRFTILPGGCDAALAEVAISGALTVTANTPAPYFAAVTPAGASTPISYTWAPDPGSGQGTAGAYYTWPAAGRYAVGVVAENCAGLVADIVTVNVQTGEAPDLAIGKVAPATAVAGERITYTLRITNSGAAPATNLAVVDQLPAGATYASGGALIGNSVTWSLPGVEGFGGIVEVSYAVTATATITNHIYQVVAAGGHGAQGAEEVVTRIVDAQANIDALNGAMLRRATPAEKAAEFMLPAGATAGPTRVTFEELSAVPYALPANKLPGGRAFRLNAYQENRPAPDFQLSETVMMTITYPTSMPEADAPRLYRWDGSGWRGENIACTANPSLLQVTCMLENPPMGVYALLADPLAVAAPPALYMPLLRR